MTDEQKRAAKRTVRVAVSGGVSLLAGMLAKKCGLVLPEWVLTTITLALMGAISGGGTLLRAKYPDIAKWLPI